MSRTLKELIVNEIRDRYQQVDEAVVVNPIFLTGRENTELRKAFNAKAIRMELMNNSLARRAFSGLPLEKVGGLLDGPSALVTGGESVIDIAKELAQWSKKMPLLKVLGAIVEGQVLDAQEAVGLSKMLGRSELRSGISAQIASPGAGIASAIASPGGAIVGCIKSLIERLENDEQQSQAA